MKLKFLSVVLFSLILVSCDKCKSDSKPEVDYTHGAFVVNEGSFGNLNGSITWTLNNVIVSNPFSEVNGTPLGDVISDFDIVNGKLYAVSNSTSKVIVMNASTFKKEAEITGFSYPRSFQYLGNGKAAVTDGSTNGTVYWVDLSTNSITGSTAVGMGPEGMAISNNHLLVCNSGGWNLDSTISAIDLSTLQVSQTYTASERPVSIEVDDSGMLWVLCSGETQYDANWTQIIGHTPAVLSRINPVDNTVTNFGVGALGDHPLHMAIDKVNHKLYISNTTVLSFDLVNYGFTDFLSLPSNGVSVNPSNQEVWVCGATDYASPSSVKVYSSNGIFSKELIAGIAAWKVEFNQ